jgi:two-component system, cell cycle sensor histidine kinase and response regulator CckA
MFGYRAEEVPESLLSLNLYSDPAVGRAVSAAIMDGKSWVGEADMVARDGRHFPAELRADSIYDERGKRIGLIGVYTDITERKMTVQALEQSEAKFRTLFEFAPDAIYLCDLQGNFVDGNRAAEELIGYSRAEVIGKSFLTLTLHSQPDLDRVATALLRHAQGESTGPTEYVLNRKDGSQVTVEIRAYPISLGKKSLVLGIGRDISQRKLLEGQLRQSQKMEAVGQLAGGIAHDFNNMLALIQGNAELLLMDADQFSGPAKEGIRHIIAASRRAANLTRQLLVFSRRQVMQSQPVFLNELIRNFTKMLARTIREDIRLECLYADPLPCVQADPGMLEQVLLNLVVNARDAMPHGGLLQITTEKLSLAPTCGPALPEPRVGEFVTLSVSDTGMGIAPENLTRIFEPFFTTKEPDQGTGLGLATVYGIVKKHGGWIELSSQVGVGSRFKIFLPAVPAPTQAAGTRETEANARGGTEQILLVEDDFALLALTQRLLEGAGYRVWKAASADEALVLWRAGASKVELLLTDLVTPGTLTGRQLAEQLQCEKPQLKVIFMSGYTPDAVCGKTDFVHRMKAPFLQKPCPSRTILEMVRSCLDGSATPTTLKL